ncbi:MAG: SWIM zinc finger family protein [Bradymonadaceae bacterium]
MSWYPKSPGPRKVDGGIKAKSKRGEIGEQWWSKRFIRVLESFSLGTRLTRGRSYARKGQVLALDVGPGAVTARVQGSRATPYSVKIGGAPLGDKDWARVEDAMAARAVFAASLLAGEMPRNIEEAFESCKTPLFPTSYKTLAAQCSCPDYANPCKHIAAVFYILAEAFDEDPFLMLRWRGRDRQDLLAALRARRAAEPDPTNVPLPVVDEPEHLHASIHTFWAAGPTLADVHPRPVAIKVPDAILQSLGPPPRELIHTRRELTELYRRLTQSVDLIDAGRL